MQIRAATNAHGLALSLVIPAYNERTRLPGFLDSVRDYLSDEFNGDYETIVVDDGSQDATVNWLLDLQECWPQLTVIKHAQNQGKGAAVRTGVLAATGKLVLFADADGATPIAEERALRNAIGAGADVAVGLRRTGKEGSSCRRTELRAFVGRIFSSLARWFVGAPISDPQCGFKMFRRDVAHALFGACRENGYLFDLHIICAASRLQLQIAEIPVSWREVAGSKVCLVRDSWRMLWGLFGIRRSVNELLLHLPRVLPVPVAEARLPRMETQPEMATAVIEP